MISDFLNDFYSEKAGEQLSQEKMNTILDYYGDDYDSLINDLYDKYDAGNINSDKVNLIKQEYDFGTVEEPKNEDLVDELDEEGKPTIKAPEIITQEPPVTKEERIKQLQEDLAPKLNTSTAMLYELKDARKNIFNDRLVKVKELQELTNTPQLEELNNIILFEEEKPAVEKLRQLYNGFGLRFEETGLGDAVKVYTKEDQNGITIDLDTFTTSGAKKELVKIKDYISNNKKDYKTTEVSDLVNAIGDTNTFINIYDETLVAKANEDLNKNLNLISEKINNFSSKEASFVNKSNAFSEALKNNQLSPDQAIKIRNELLKEQEDLKAEREELKTQYNTDVVEFRKDLNKIQAEQTSILANRGTWVESWYNTVLEVPDLITRASNDVGNIFSDAIVDLKKYTGIIDADEAEKQRAKNEIEKKIRNSFSLKEEIGADVTNEYQEKFMQTTWGQVSTSIVQMLATAALPGVGQSAKAFGALMGVQEGGRILEEMDRPEFDDVPDWQKVAFGGAVGYAVYLLEKLGASYLVGKNPIAKSVVARVFKNNIGKKLSQETVESLIENEIKSVLAKGAFKVGSGMLMEGGTEAAQEMSTAALKKGFNYMQQSINDNEKNYFKEVDTKILDGERIFQAFKVGALAGGAFGTFNAFVESKREKKINQLNERQYKAARAFFLDKNSLQNEITRVNEEIQNDPTKKEEGERYIRDLQEVNEIFQELRNSTRLTSDGEKIVFSLMQEKRELQKQIEAASDKSLTKNKQQRVSEINTQIENIVTDSKYDFDQQFASLKEETQQQTEKQGKDFNSLDEDSYNEALGDLGLNENEYKGSTGYIHTDGNIYINETVAEDLREIPVTTHELLHGILNKQLEGKTPEESKKIINDFKKRLNRSQREAVNRRLKNEYGKDENDATSQEWFTALSDGIINDEVDFQESGFQELGRLLTNVFLKPFGYKNASFKNGRQAFNFVRDYAKQSKAIAEGKQQTFEGQVGEIVSEGISTAPEGAMSRKDLTNLAKSYKSDPAEADIEQLLQQYRNVAFKALGFDQSKGDIPSSEAQSFVDAEFTNIINRYDESTEFSTWVNSNIRPKRQQFYQEQIGDTAESLDKQEARQIADEGPARREVSEKQARQESRKIKVAKRLGVEEQIKKEVDKKVKDLDVTKLNYKKLKNLGTETVGELFGVSPKKLVNNANLTKSEIANAQRFIAKNVDLLMSLLPEGYSSDFTSSGVPKVLLENFYNQRSVRAKTGPGLKVQIKKPDIKTNEFLEVFGFVDGKPTRDDRNISSRIIALANQAGKMMTNQTVREQAILQGVDPAKLQTLSSPVPQGFFSKTSSNNQGRTLDEILDDIYGREDIPDNRKDQLFGEALRIKLQENPEATIRDIITSVARGLEIKEGFAYEQVLYDVINDAIDQYNIPGLQLSAGPTEVGGAADIVLTYYGQTIGIEVKKGNARFSSVTASYDTDGEIITKKNYTFDKILKKVLQKAKPQIDAYIKEANRIGPKLVKGYKPIKYITEAIPEEVYEDLQNRGFQKAITQNIEITPEFVSELYWAKANGTAYIQIQGLGTYYLTDPSGINTENPLNLDVPAFTDASLTLTFSTGSNSANNPKSYDNKDLEVRAIKADGSKKRALPGSRGFRRISLRFQPSKITGLEKSSLQLDQPASIAKGFSQADINNKITKEQNPAFNSNLDEFKSTPGFSKSMNNSEVLSYAATLDEALSKARKLNEPVKKIRVFDFDDTLAKSNNIVFATRDGQTIQLNAEEFAKQGDKLLSEGFEFDFTDFNTVRDGSEGPLLKLAKRIRDARGNEDIFVLTARAPEAQGAIYEFLKSQDLELKQENIVGLGNSTGAAKASWIVGKAAEGYNDFYFADDAIQNVQAVQDVLDQIDVKSKVQQAKGNFSKNINEDFNKIIEQTTGIASEKRYSKAKAKVRGANKGNKKFFIPYSAEDFMGLIYPLLSKGKLGDSQMSWFKLNVLDPYARAIENLSRDRIQMMQDFRALKKSLEVPKDLRKTNDSGFTNEQAVRVYLFNKMGYDIPGLSKSDLNELIDIVNADGKLKAFADQILSVTKGDGYVKPSQEWLAGNITTDLIDLLNTTKRRKYLEQSGYLDNVNEIFSEENLNKLEAAYGSKYRESLENILARMKSGKNRLFSGSRLSNRVLDYINGSIGTIMFFNTRSAVLQTISSINFLNWSFNNPIKAGKAFANQKQYWKDFKMLMNSDYLTDRRNGLKLNISENEIANAAATAKNKARGAMNYILQKGYLPTQFADSFAIAAGGATFYRNRVNDLVSKGIDVKQAEQQALSEWKETAEVSQQSSDPSKISQQQASDLGRVILAFANTPMQYARLQKRAAQDLINRRGDPKSNVSRIIYYGVVQNLIFNALQQAVFALGFGEDEEDEKKQEKYLDIGNGMLDSQLRGLGIAGATTAVVKNFLLDIYERSGRKRPEYVDAVYKLLQLSPPISSKISKVRQAAYQFDSKKRRQEIFDKGFSIDNPAYEATAKVISATTNLPLDRLLNKANNIEAALSEDVETWQRVAMLAGWPEWQIMPKVNKSKNEFVKGFKPSKKDMSDYNVMKKLNKSEQEEILKNKGYSDYEIRRMKREDDRIKAIMKRNK